MLRPTPKLNTGRGRWMVLLFSFHSTRPPPPPRPNSLIHKSLRLRLQLTSNVIPTTFSPPRPLNSSVHHPTARPTDHKFSNPHGQHRPANPPNKQAISATSTFTSHHTAPPRLPAPLSTDDNRTRAQDFPTGLSVRRVVSTTTYSTLRTSPTAHRSPR